MPYRKNTHIVDLRLAFDPEPSCAFIAGGLGDGQGAVVVARRDNADAIRKGLLKRGVSDPDGVILFADAETRAAQLAGGPDSIERCLRETNRELIEAAIARSDDGRVVVYTETPGILWRRGHRTAAINLERFWDGVRARMTASIVCGYSMDPLDCAQQPFDVVELHELARGFDDAARLERYAQAVEKVLRAQSTMVRKLVLEDPRLAQLPYAHGAMIWLCRNMPKMAARVAAVAQAR